MVQTSALKVFYPLKSIGYNFSIQVGTRVAIHIIKRQQITFTGFEEPVRSLTIWADLHEIKRQTILMGKDVK